MFGNSIVLFTKLLCLCYKTHFFKWDFKLGNIIDCVLFICFQEYLLQKSKPSPWLFPRDVVSDKNDYDIVQHIVESKLYDDLPNEVPYNLKVQLEYFEISREGNFFL